MELLALLVWIATIALGTTLLVSWLRGGGHRQPQDESEPGPLPGISIHLLVPHVVVALAGLGVWAVFTFRAETRGMSYTPAAASVALAIVVALGILLLRRWRRALSDPGVGGGAERRMRPAVVAAHGVGAAATVTLVLANVFVD